jgi:hypothetical protein
MTIPSNPRERLSLPGHAPIKNGKTPAYGPQKRPSAYDPAKLVREFAFPRWQGHRHSPACRAFRHAA